jgi:hypothetical protein
MQLQVLAPYLVAGRLPGFIGPVPPPLRIRDTFVKYRNISLRIIEHILKVSTGKLTFITIYLE